MKTDYINNQKQHDLMSGAATGAAVGSMGGLMGALAGAGIGAAGSLVGGAINSIFSNQSINKQVSAQEQLADYNANLQYQEQMKMWNETNYPAQVQQMMQAGLNPALMYRGAGGGGATTGSGLPTQNVTPTQQNNGAAIAQQALQGMMMKAQIDNLNAQTQETLSKVAANQNTTNVQNSQIQANQASANLQNANAELSKTQNTLEQLNINYKQNTLDASIDQVRETAKIIGQQLAIIQNDKEISDATKQIKIQQQIENVAETIANIHLKQSGIELNQKQIWQIGQVVSQNWEYIKQGQQNANTQEQAVKTNYTNTQEALEMGWRKIGLDQRSIQVLEDRSVFQNIHDIIGSMTGAVGAAAIGSNMNITNKQPNKIGFK